MLPSIAFPYDKQTNENINNVNKKSHVQKQTKYM